VAPRDDALALVRVSAELVNLIQGKKAHDKDRFNQFRGVEVRKRLESGWAIPIADTALYAKLCEVGVHVSPVSAALSHDLEGRKVYVGPGALSIRAFLLVLSELVYLTANCLPEAVRLAEHSDDKMQLATSAQSGLLGLLSWLRISNYEKVMMHFREKHEAE